MANNSKSKPPEVLTNAVSWQAKGIMHKKNKIFLNVIEKLILFVSANGMMLHSEIYDAVKIKPIPLWATDLALTCHHLITHTDCGVHPGGDEGILVPAWQRSRVLN
jgi:hypothetical protein